MILDPGFDRWVWLAFFGLLVVLGARAWVVETGRGRLTSTPGRVRALTVASVGMVAVLVGLMAVQGGSQVVHSVLTRTDPVTGLPLDQPAAPVVDPNAPAADPAAPAAGDPAAPAAPVAGTP
jgi:hypothetical protein